MYAERSQADRWSIFSDPADGSASAGIAAGHRRQPLHRINNTTKYQHFFNVLDGHGRWVLLERSLPLLQLEGKKRC